MKIVKLIVVCIVLLYGYTGKSQSFNWLNSAGGAFDDLSAKVIHGTNDFYLYGNFQGTVNITNTKSGIPLELVSRGWGWDIFLISIDTLGQVNWAKSYGSNDYDSTLSVRFCKVDSTILLIGNHTGDFYYNQNQTDFITTSGSALSSAILKIKENGDIAAIKTTGEYGLTFHTLYDMQMRGSDYFLTGTTGHDLHFPKKTGVGDTIIPIATISSRAFLVSLDKDFKFNFLTPSPKEIFKFEFDSIGNIYGVGRYDNGWNENTSLIKFTSNGTFKYNKLFKTNSYSMPKYNYLNIISNNQISFTSYSSDTTFFDNINLYTSPLSVWNTHQPFEFFSLRLDSLGNITKLLPYEIGTNMVYGVDFNINALGESYFTMPFTGTVSVNGNTYTSNGSTDILLCAFDANANYNWVQSFGSAGEDYCNSITFDRENNPVLHGTFESTITINQSGQKTSNPISISSNGGKDVFYAKINRAENVATGISGNVFQNLDLNVFPNPSSKKIFIKVNGNSSKYQFELYNSLGQQFNEKVIGSDTEEIDVSNCESGVYTYKIYNDNYKATGKLIIMN